MIPSRIKEMSFSMLSPEMVKTIARVRVVNSDLYDADGYPVEGGVMDPRLGVIDPGLHCRTCGGSIGECPGHFGYLELAKPVIHVLYTKIIYKLLKFTCRKCNRIMFKDGKAIKERALAPTKCPHCKAKQKKITFVKPYTFYSDKTELTPMDIREKFEKISKKDLEKVDFRGGRPEWLLLTLFPIPPVTMRPSITLETGERSEDDLTHKMVDIVRINQSLKENIDIGAPDFILADLWELVQYHTSTYFDNELTGAPLARHRSGRPLKGIVQRLKAKEGRIRGNLLGKRVNFSSRTVIIPDPKISINEVGVPDIVAKELSIPMQITELNMKEIKDLIKMDKVNYVIRPDGRRIKLTLENKKDLLENIALEWFIDRQLQNGDIVLFNRQPSLHRVSMMAHRVRIMPYRSFRLNPSVCFPYNADFDGDEMNLHVPQTEEARAEAHFLMDVQENLISPRFGGPLVGCDLEQISGIYMLTSNDVKLSREDACQLLATSGIDMDIPNKDSFTGKEIFSLILPKELNLEFTTKTGKGLSMEEKKKIDAWVVIKDGKLLHGRVGKKGVGTEDGKIIGKLSDILESTHVREFIDNCGRLGSQYLVFRGFSMGISDLDLPSKSMIDVKLQLDKAQKEADELVVSYRKGKIKVLPGMTPEESMEAQVMNALASGISRIADIVSRTIPKTSDMINMANAGAKGSMINISQMAAGVGQETIMGARIERGYMNRTLPHMKINDLSPLARGFVASGFKQGLKPFEFFWNIMNGREGLMDKSLRTRKSGYMQRRLVNALQDLMVNRDGSVRDSKGVIVQFKAGEDGIDPSKSDFGKLAWMDAIRKVKEGKNMKLPPKLHDEMAEYFEKHKISPDMQKKMLAEATKMYERISYDPQEAVGVVCAQSLSEPATQMTMRTYHFAGTAGIQVTLGLPRMLEIFDARKEPRTPTMTVKILPEFMDIEKVKKIANDIKEVKAKDAILHTTLDLAEMCIKAKFNVERLKVLGIDPDRLPKILKIRNADVTIKGDILFVVSKKKDMKALHKLKYGLLETHLKGIKGVSQVVVTKEEGQWVINTLGSNLKKVFAIPGVDAARTKSNNIFEIYDLLGVEAARNAIVEQAVFTMEEQGLNVDVRYIMMLADLMTVKADVRAIGRYGISGKKDSVLVRVSFEETKKHLITAAIRGEKDDLDGTIENIMMNQVAPIGTGAFDLVGHISRLKKEEKPKKKEEKPKKKEEKPKKEPKKATKAAKSKK